VGPRGQTLIRSYKVAILSDEYIEGRFAVQLNTDAFFLAQVPCSPKSCEVNLNLAQDAVDLSKMIQVVCCL